MSIVAMTVLFIASAGKSRICGGTLVDADDFARAQSSVLDFGFTRNEAEVFFRCSNDRSACVVVDGICGERVWIRRDFKEQAKQRFENANATIDCRHPTSTLSISRWWD